MENSLEYYIIDRDNNNNYPRLTVKKGGAYENSDEFINNPESMEYRLGEPVPKKTLMVDYHSSVHSIVSKKIADVLNSYKIEGIQLIPATITGKDNELYDNYYFIHIYKLLEVMDRSASIYEWDDFLEIANPIEKLVLDNKVLSEIPLEHRLIFKLKENYTFQLYHKSVVDAIMVAKPEGIKFTKVLDWTIGTAFD